jgi:hypothetical protein
MKKSTRLNIKHPQNPGTPENVGGFAHGNTPTHEAYCMKKSTRLNIKHPKNSGTPENFG